MVENTVFSVELKQKRKTQCSLQLKMKICINLGNGHEPLDGEFV